MLGLAAPTVDSTFFVVDKIFKLTLSERHAVVKLLWFVALCIINGWSKPGLLHIIPIIGRHVLQIIIKLAWVSTIHNYFLFAGRNIHMLLGRRGRLVVIWSDISIEVLIDSPNSFLTDLLRSWLLILWRQNIDGSWHLLWILIENVTIVGIILRHRSELNRIADSTTLFLPQVDIHVDLWVLFLVEHNLLLCVSIISISSSGGCLWTNWLTGSPGGWFHDSVWVWGIWAQRRLLLVIL